MLPNIFPFDGCTGPAQQLDPPTLPPEQVPTVTVEVTMEEGEGGGGRQEPEVSDAVSRGTTFTTGSCYCLC